MKSRHNYTFSFNLSKIAPNSLQTGFILVSIFFFGYGILSYDGLTETFLNYFKLFCFLLLMGLLILNSHFGLDIDMDKLIFRKYASFLWIKTGKWKPFKKPNKLVLSKIIQTSNSNSMYGSFQSGSEFYKLYFIFENEDFEEICKSESKKLMVKSCKIFADTWNIEFEEIE